MISLINLLVFIPIYSTGYPKDIKELEDPNKNIQWLALLTVMNITAVDNKIIAIYVIMTIVYTLCSFIFMYFYWKKSLDWRYKKHSHTEKFMDHDVALHSLMVTNLPTEVNLRSMNAKLKMVFERIFPEKVITAKAIAKLDDLYSMALRLRDLKKEFRYYKMLNKNANEKGEPRKTIKKRKGCFRGAQKHDAEEYYKAKIKKKIREIRKERERKLKINGGFGFITFISNIQVKKCLYKNDFKRLIMENLT